MPRRLGGTSDAPRQRAGIGLNEAIEMGLARNPDLQIARQAEGVSQGILGVAATYPFNPTFQVRYLPFDTFATGQSATEYRYFLLWQQFELCHQKRHRSNNAAELLDGVRRNIQQLELVNVSMTAQLYFAALYQAGLRDLAERVATVNDKWLAVMERRLAAGSAAGADVAIIRLDARSSRQQLKLAVITYENALRALRRHLNLPPNSPLELDADFSDFVWREVTGAALCELMDPESTAFRDTADPEELSAELAAGRPDVLAARANARAADANVALARAAMVPNLWLGPFYDHDAENIISAGFQAQFDIPVCNNGKPLLRQREAELLQQRTTAEQLEAKARVDVRTALDRYAQALQIYQQTHNDFKAEIPIELRKLEAQFEKGDIDILRITQARTSLIQLRRTYLDSLNELSLAAAALTAASGLPPAAMISRHNEVTPPRGGPPALP